MNSQSQSSSSSAQSSSRRGLFSRLAEMTEERNRADCLISELRFLASMIRHDGVLHNNIAIITEKADAHIKRRWSLMATPKA